MRPYEESQRTIFLWTGIALVVWMLLVLLFFLAQDSYVWLGTEDELGENMTSVFYFAAGFLLIAMAISRLRRREVPCPKLVLPLLLGLFFIFVGGEEISWGQRILGIKTPEVLRESNVQGEMTLHNLTFFDRHKAILNQHTVLNLFALMVGVLAPLSYALVGWLRRLANALGFPVAPLSSVMWFVTGLAHSQTLAKIDGHWSHTEIKELIFSVGFLASALVIWSSFGRRGTIYSRDTTS